MILLYGMMSMISLLITAAVIVGGCCLHSLLEDLQAEEEAYNDAE